MKEKLVQEITRNTILKIKELDKFFLIYSRIAHKVSYDLNQIERENDRLKLQNGKANSLGYAEIIKECLERTGIESIIVNGKIGTRKHSWNKVKIDKYWYNTDITLDRENILESKNLQYTLKSDKDFKMHISSETNLPKSDISLPNETLEEYEYIIKYESNKLDEIVKKIKSKTESYTILTYNIDEQEVLTVNDKGIEAFPATKEQFFYFIDENKINIYMLQDIKDEYNRYINQLNNNNLPAVYEEDKLVSFITKIVEKLVSKFFKNSESLSKDISYTGQLNTTSKKNKNKLVEKKEEIR